MPTPEQILHRLDWKVIRRLDGLLQGDYRTLFYGDGLDFADLREYQIEDDIRHIDWNVTARTNSLHVRQYVEDRDITAWERSGVLVLRRRATHTSRLAASKSIIDGGGDVRFQYVYRLRRQRPGPSSGWYTTPLFSFQSPAGW